MDVFLAAMVGGMVATLVCLFVLVPMSPNWIEEDRSIVYTTDSGIVCKFNKSYPDLNCKLVKEAVGSKLNEFTVKGK